MTYSLNTLAAGRASGNVTRKPMPSRLNASGSGAPSSSTRRTWPALVGPEAARLWITSSPVGQAMGRANRSPPLVVKRMSAASNGLASPSFCMPSTSLVGPSP